MNAFVPFPASPPWRRRIRCNSFVVLGLIFRCPPRLLTWNFVQDARPSPSPCVCATLFVIHGSDALFPLVHVVRRGSGQGPAGKEGPMVLQVPVAGGQRQRRNGRRREWGDTLQSVFVATTEVARAVADMPACMHACMHAALPRCATPVLLLSFRESFPAWNSQTQSSCKTVTGGQFSFQWRAFLKNAVFTCGKADRSTVCSSIPCARNIQ